MQDSHPLPPDANSEFFRHLSHEIRTPLNSIVGLSQILSKSSPLTPKQQEMLNTLHNSALSLHKLIDSMLTASKDEPPPQPAAPQTPSPEHIRVLVAEDHAPNVLVVTTLLESLGYAYEVAGTGRQVLEKLKQGKPYHIILMDVEMPELNGYETTQKLREEEQKMSGKHLPVIGVTAHVVKANIDKCYTAGMDDYIQKPLNADDLQRKITALVNPS